mgnify:CR=1 FL=1
MALNIQVLGKGISTEKYILRATTNDVLVTSVLLRISVDGIAGAFIEVEQDPNILNPLQFDFEIDDMLRNAFEFQFMDLQASTSFNTQVVYANELFQEVTGATVSPTIYQYYTKLKNITQGVFEIESFDLINYHLGNDGSSTRKFLTTAPIIKDLAEGESEFLTASSWDYTVPDVSTQQWVIESYDSSGVLINTTSEPMTVQTPFGGFVFGQAADNSAIRLVGEAGVANKKAFVADVAGVTESISNVTFGNSGSFFGYGELVDGNNGFLYACPHNASQIFKIDPLTNGISPVGTFPASGALYLGGKLASNGFIYWVGYNRNDILVLNTADDSLTTIGALTAGGSKYAGADITTAGVMYSAGATANTVLKVDTNTNTVTEFGSATDFFITTYVASNGFAYCFPQQSTKNIIKINLTTDAITVVGVSPIAVTSNLEYSCVTEENGFLYFVERDSTNPTAIMHKINLATDAFTSFVLTVTTFASAYQSVISRNGLIYVLGLNEGNILVVDPLAADAVSVALTVPNFPNYRFPALSLTNNNIYIVPSVPSSLSATTEIKLVSTPIIGTIRSETKCFENKKTCGGVRLHWLNEFGQQDSFTFDGKVTKSIMTTFDSFKRIRPVDPSSTDVGDLVYKSEYGQEWAIFTRVVPPSAIEWLSKSLVNNRAAIEVNGKYFPIIIKDKKKVTSDSFNPVFQFAISFMFANKRKGIQ